MNNLDNHQLVNQTSGNTEWYSPIELVEAARRVMGEIDYDPASSYRANHNIVRANRFCAAPEYEIVGEIGGLPVRHYQGGGLALLAWYGRIWMNHPFGNTERACSPKCTKKTCQKRGWHTHEDIAGNTEWVRRIVNDYLAGYTVEACVLTFAATSEAWFTPLKQCPMCLIDGRINYLDPVTLKPVKGVTKGSVVTYLGENRHGFVREYSQFGPVMIPAAMTKYYQGVTP
ncbi:hypothetical protein KC887_07860 [Candidatus Kaiserbacteria bacterium]|nr:hypothetical protein [Candidatus Kaiserbacteria bacterium]